MVQQQAMMLHQQQMALAQQQAQMQQMGGNPLQQQRVELQSLMSQSEIELMQPQHSQLQQAQIQQQSVHQAISIGNTPTNVVPARPVHPAHVIQSQSPVYAQVQPQQQDKQPVLAQQQAQVQQAQMIQQQSVHQAISIDNTPTNVVPARSVQPAQVIGQSPLNAQQIMQQPGPGQAQQQFTYNN